MAVKISEEIASQTIEKWLDYKRIPEKKREEFEDQIAELVSAIMDGKMSMDENSFELTYTLNYPVGEEAKIESLTFKPRISVGDIRKSQSGVKAGDATGLMVAYASALTGKPKGVIEKLDSSDFKVPQSIVVFFL